MATLTSLSPPRQPADRVGQGQIALWRSAATAISEFKKALDEAAVCMDPAAPVSLAEFWKAAVAILRLWPLRVPDRRRNVVHVLSAYEARQWELPVVFICGLGDKQFPRHHHQDPIFPDSARRALRRSGVRLLTTADREQEERLLFDMARTRATSTLVLSYPKADAQGATQFPSPFLPPLSEQPPVWVRPQPLRPDGQTAARAPIREPDLLNLLETRHRTLSPTALECFLDCPFQFFARYTLKLARRPSRPFERLDFLLQGSIVHRVLAEIHREPQEVGSLFERIFREECATHCVPPGYRTELIRHQLLDDICRFLDNKQVPRAAEGWVEWPFEMALSDSFTVRGRIDRIDSLPDGRALLVDYKYSAAPRVWERARKKDLLQGPLYVLAVERLLGLRAAGMFYFGLRREPRRNELVYAGWREPELTTPHLAALKAQPLTLDWVCHGEQAALAANTQIREGRIAPSPADPDLCRTCDYRDVCRYEETGRTLVAEAAIVRKRLAGGRRDAADS